MVRVACCVGATGAFICPSASAAAPPEACFKAYEQGQRLERDRQPLAARSEYTSCAALCPEPLRTDCKTWKDHTETQLARIVLRVAHVESDVRIFLDDEPIAPEARPVVWVSPGSHELRASADGFSDQLQTLDLLEGEEHPVVISLARVEAPVETSSVRPAPWIALGAGAVGFAGFGYFGLSGLNKKSELDDCRTHCSAQSVDAARRDFLLADVSLLVGLIGTGIGVTLLLTPAPSSSLDAASRQRRAVRLEARPLSGGVGIWLGADAW